MSAIDKCFCTFVWPKDKKEGNENKIKTRKKKMMQLKKLKNIDDFWSNSY